MIKIITKKLTYESVDLQVGVQESGVGETVSEGPLGNNIHGIVPLVSNQQLLSVAPQSKNNYSNL